MIFVYILLFFTSLIFYIQFEGPFSFYLFCFVASYPFILGGIMLYLKRKIRVSFEHREINAMKGSNVPVNIVIDNPTRLPLPSCDITIKYKTDITDKYETLTIHSPVFPNNTQVLTMKYMYGHYGSLSLEITKIKILDILKLIRFRVRPRGCLLSTRILVYPNLIPLDNTINDYSELGLESDTFSKSKKGDDPSEIFNLHEYIEGDKMSRIHWKLSAKQPEMMVKDYSLPIVNGILIVADFSRLKGGEDDLDKVDAIIDAFSAISFRLAENEITHTLMWSSDSPEGCETAVVSDFDSYITATRRFITDGLKTEKGSVCEAISALSTGVPKYAHTIICAADLSEEDKTALTDSDYAYRYTAVVVSNGNDSGYSEDKFTFVPLLPDSIAESIESIAI